MAAGAGADSSSGGEEDCEIPAQIKFAASMSELQRMALEERFSDEDSDGESSGDEASVPGKVQDAQGPVVPKEGAFARVSRILFGSATSLPQRQIDGDDESSSSSSEDDED